MEEQTCIQELTNKRDAFKQKLDDNKDFLEIRRRPILGWINT